MLKATDPALSLALDPSVRESSFLRSALTADNRFQELDEVRAWLAAQRARPYRVEQVPLEDLADWHFEPGSGDLAHHSGRFFRVEGLRVTTDFPACRGEFDQPIINQPEVGILGLLTRVFDGVRYFLVQAKMEPGNLGLVQLAPTLQATHSNYSRVHKGKQPRYLEYFLDPHARILVDQLQSEQGTRFLRKRNRNVIVEVEQDVELTDDFRWLTLAEIKELLHEHDVVNMDTRTVLSCIPWVEPALLRHGAGADLTAAGDLEVFGQPLTGFARDLFLSAADGCHAVHDTDAVISWLTRLKTTYSLGARSIGLQDVREWSHVDGVLRHDSGRHFEVVGLDVRAGDREVVAWNQPILQHRDLGLVSFLTQRHQGVLHFLVQGKVEPGVLDTLEMGATVSVFDARRRLDEGDATPFLAECLDAPPERIRFSAELSEEGGRLYHLRNCYRVVEIPEDQHLELPPYFIWMTLQQIMTFLRFNNYFNIEARSLISCLGLLPSARDGAAR